MFKKILVWLFVVVVTLMMLLWSFSPLLIRTAANTVLESNQLYLSDDTQVRINPFAFVIEAKHFALVHDEKPLVEFDRLYIDVDPTRLLWNQVTVSKLELSGLSTNAEQNQDALYLNGVDLLALFATEAKTDASEADKVDQQTDSEAKTQTTSPYSLLVKNVAMTDFDVAFKNPQANVNATLTSLRLNQLKGSTEELSLDLELDVTLGASANDMELQSRVQFETNVNMLARETVSIDVTNTDLSITDLIAKVAGYRVEQQSLNLSSNNVALVSDENGPKINGDAAFKLEQVSVIPLTEDTATTTNKTLTLASVTIPEITIEQQQQPTPQVKIPQVGVSQLDVMVPESTDDNAVNLLSMTSLDVVDVLANAESLAINQIKLGKVDVNANVLSDKSLSPLFLAKTPNETQEQEQVSAEQVESGQDSSETQTIKETKTSSDFAIALNEFVLSKQLDVFFEDNSVAPMFKTHLYLDQVSLRDIDSQAPETVAKLVVRGGMDEYTKISLDGDLQAFLAEPKFVLKGDVKELSLPELSPYVDQALGYVIETGVLNNEFDVVITGPIVDGESRSLLQSIDLTAVEQDGEKNTLSGGAISLNMAINMLKDGDGNVELDVPISGDLNNPSIGVSGIVALIVKQATMSAAKDYLITTFLPYAEVVKIALSASESLLKMSFEPMPYEQSEGALTETQKSYLSQFAEVFNTQSDIKVKICPIATKIDGSNGNAEAQLTLAKAAGAKVKEYLVQQLDVESQRLFSCAAALDEEGQSRVEFIQL